MSEKFGGTQRYSILRQLGEGGFGVVYLAQDNEHNTKVALKVLRQRSPESLYRFKREFRTLTDLIHPNLITLYQLVSDDTQCFFTMEYVEGVDFLEYILGYINEDFINTEVDLSAETQKELITEKSTLIFPRKQIYHKRALDFSILRDLLIQLCEGLSFIHKAGKLHRDIKPSNILVTSEGRLVILDFGLLADTTNDAEQSLNFAGTPSYMSPEQASGIPVTESSDWYSVGVMLYETLTGQLPFDGSIPEIIQNKKISDAVPPSDFVTDIPDDLNTLCKELLQRNPEMRPNGEEILLRLKDNYPAESKLEVTPKHKPIPTFVGRDEHLADLTQAYSDVRNGLPATMCVSGKSGMGKSALIKHFLNKLKEHDRNAVVLTGKCYEQETVPYKALDSIIDALSRYLKLLSPSEAGTLIPRNIQALTRLFPVLQQVNAIQTVKRREVEIPDSQELRRRAFSALRDLLARLAERKLLILFIDDLQWGDLDSIALISELLRPPDPPIMFLIACYRSEDIGVSPALQMLKQFQINAGSAINLRELNVGELTFFEARDLALKLLSETHPKIIYAEIIARESGANPFFIHELSRYSLVRQKSNISDQITSREQSNKDLSETTLDKVIWTRVSSLPKLTLNLLELIAVAGRPILLEIVKKAIEPEIVDNQSIVILRSQNLIRVREVQDRDEIETYHDRIRETVIGHLSDEKLKTYHNKLAFALEDSGNADLESLVTHFYEAGLSEKAAKYAAAAASQSTETLAFDRAVRLYRLAIDLKSSDSAELLTLQRKLGDALVNDGRGNEAAEIYMAVAESSYGVEKLEMQQRAAEQFLRSGRIDEGLLVLRSLLSAVGLSLPETPRSAIPSLIRRRAQIWIRGYKFQERTIETIPTEELMKIDICWTASVGLSTVDTLRGANFQAIHLLLALKSGELYRIARAIATEAGFSAASGGRNQKQTRKLIDMATVYAEKTNHPHAIGITNLAAGLTNFFSGQWRPAKEMFEQAEKILSNNCKGVTWELNVSRLYTLVSLIYMGEMAEIERRLPGILKEAQERGDLWATTNLQILVSYLMYLVKDKITDAKREATRAIELWSHQGVHNQHWHNLLALGEIALYSEDGLDAWKLTEERYPSLQRSLTLRPQVSYISAMRLRARCALAATNKESRIRQRKYLLKSAEQDAQRIEHENMPWGNALAHLIHAGVAASSKQTDNAIHHLVLAESKCRAADMLLFANVAHRRYGQLIGGENGKSMVEKANKWMVGQKIKNPDRITSMLAPGEWDSS